MRTTILRLALLGAALAAHALAQNTPPAPSRMPGATTPNAGAGATTPRPGATGGGNAAARVDDGTRTAPTPAAGANSFTEGQARSRIESAGYTNVRSLQKDDQGIWRGEAQQNGRAVGVALDFQGNVTPVR